LVPPNVGNIFTLAGHSLGGDDQTPGGHCPISAPPHRPGAERNSTATHPTCSRPVLARSAGEKLSLAAGQVFGNLLLAFAPHFVALTFLTGIWLLRLVEAAKGSTLQGVHVNTNRF